MSLKRVPLPTKSKYFVSSKGRVYRRTKRGRNVEVKGWKHRSKYEYDKYYRRVCLYMKDGSRSNWYIHRLVLLTFEGPPPEGMDLVRHKGDSLDNRLEMLEYGTFYENQVVDRKRDGTYYDRGGTKNTEPEDLPF